MGFLVLPPIIRSVAVKQLSKQLGREVSIEKIKLNPFSFSCAVRGLLIKDRDGQTFVSWDEVYVNFQLSSFLGHPWVFKEISVTRPFARARMNRDGTFNFSDLVAKFSTSAPAASPAPARPLALRVDRLHIGGATAEVADFTPREPFRRTIGPLDITLDNFRTDPDNRNPYAFTGTTDAGETIAWSGHFYLTPLRSEGELKLFNFTLNKYAPLYQDLVRFEIRSGSIAMDLNYRLEWSETNRVAAISDTAFGLRDFKLGAPGDSNSIIELAALAVTGMSADLESRRAAVGSVSVNGGTIFLNRAADNSVNVVELAKPAESVTNAPGGILFLLRSVTNAVAMLLNSTNQWSGAIRSVTVTNCALHLEDDVNSRPARLDLTDITLDAKNISNVPGTNLTAELSMRWNTNGSIKVATTASFLPTTADVQLDLDQLDLGTLDPYLEPKLNLYILGSKVGLHGKVSLRTPQNALPEVTFRGDASLDDFHTVDGVMAEDLVKWDSIGFNGIDANLNPQTVSIREIDVNGAYARLVIETNKTINLLNALRMTSTNAPATNETEIANSKPAREDARPTMAATNAAAALPQISIGAINITNTAINFTDRSLQPNVNLAIGLANGSISGLSTEQLQHADITLNAVIDGVGHDEHAQPPQHATTCGRCGVQFGRGRGGLHQVARHACSTSCVFRLGCRLRSVEPGQEPGDQPVDPVRTDPGPADEPDEQENGRGTDLPIEPVPGQRPEQGSHQQEDPYLGKEGEIGSGLARQSARSVAAANWQRQTPGALARGDPKVSAGSGSHPRPGPRRPRCRWYGRHPSSTYGQRFPRRPGPWTCVQ